MSAFEIPFSKLVSVRRHGWIWAGYFNMGRLFSAGYGLGAIVCPSSGIMLLWILVQMLPQKIMVGWVLFKVTQVLLVELMKRFQVSIILR